MPFATSYFRKRSIAAAFLAATALLAGRPQSASAALLYDINNSSQGTAFSFTGNWGFRFETTQAITVRALGLWDEGSDGLVGSHQVGIFTGGSSNPLASATVTTNGLIEPSTASSGRWIFVNLDTPVTLPGGASYEMGYFTARNTTPDPFRGQTNTTFLANATYTTSLANANSTVFGNPGGTAGGNVQGYFGPNLSTTTIVPEPASLGLLGIASVGLLRRRRRR